MNIYSHPDILLEEHLSLTEKIALTFLNEKSINLKNMLEKPLSIICRFHDVGKATTYFQDMLLFNRIINKELCKHSLLSSIVTYYMAKKHNLNDDLAFFCYATVRQHHTELKNFKDLSVNTYDVKILHNQMQSLNKTFLKNINVSDININNILLDIKDFIFPLHNENLHKNYEDYILFLMLYSLLIDSDILHAGLNYQECDLQRLDISNMCNLVNNYIKANLETKQLKLNEIRNKILQEVDNFDYTLANSNRIFKMQLPTGAGKTLSGFHFALRLRDFLKRNGKGNYRIIYCLPYLSIIEQNYEVIKDVFNSNQLDVSSQFLLKHHHLIDLAEIRYNKTEIDEEIDLHKSEIFVESWNAEIIVTTFYQLFHTLFTNKKNNLKKFHKLSNAIIVIDEVQVITPVYFKLIDEFLSFFVNYVDSYLVLLTATQPKIFCNAVDIIKNFKDIASNDLFNRYKIIYEPQEITINNFVNHFKIEKDKTYLFILNTIKSAKLLYDKFKEKYPDIPKTYLSTHVLSCDRLKRINEIKQRKYNIIVSTQLVEAGVDIDVDVVVRDLAGLDSIVQSAGRCNREGHNQQGNVFVVCFKDENTDRLYASYIYDSVILSITHNILQKTLELEEKDIYHYLDEYFTQIDSSIRKDESNVLLNSIKNLDFETIKDFSLIDEKFAVNIFVCIDLNAQMIYNEFLRIQDIKDYRTKKREFNKIKKDFYEYILSIRYNKNDNILNFLTRNKNLYIIEYDKIEQYYNKETGLITNLTIDNII